jgi:hypothetical protein
MSSRNCLLSTISLTRVNARRALAHNQKRFIHSYSKHLSANRAWRPVLLVCVNLAELQVAPSSQLTGPYLTGAITVVQRFGSALNLNIHFHILMCDGVYVTTADGSLKFVEMAKPTSDEIVNLVGTLQRRMLRVLQRKGRRCNTVWG